MSTTVQVILITALVLGLVALVFGLVHLWNTKVEGTAREQKIVCGHWSTLGLFVGHGVHAIDTGAVCPAG